MGRFLEKVAVAAAPLPFPLLALSTSPFGQRSLFPSFPPPGRSCWPTASPPWSTTRSSPIVQINSRWRKRKSSCEQNYRARSFSAGEGGQAQRPARLDRARTDHPGLQECQGGFIPDTYTNERINDVIREEYGGDRVAFIKTLYERGVTMQKYRDEIQDNAIVGYMRNKNVVQTVLVSPYQIEQYYQQNLRLFVQDEQIKVSTIVLRKALFPPRKPAPTASRSPTIRRRKSPRKFSTSSTPAPISPTWPNPIRRPPTRTTGANSAG
jgi:hypothetical protein